jgi:S1-C subfamily serine protease
MVRTYQSILLAPVSLFFLVNIAVAQTRRPTPDLIARFERVSCAVIRIESAGNQGTGFFISKDGTLVTVAHNILDRSYSLENGQIRITVTPKENIRARLNDGREVPLTVSLGPDDAARASADLAIVRTGLQTPCFLRLGKSDSIKVGEHLIALGYPALEPTVVLYDGFLSSRHAHLPLPIGYIGSQPLYATYEVLRVQMPITAGASGSPLMLDDDSVVGVISEIPRVWTEDLSRLTKAMMSSPSGSGILLSGFDTTKLLGQLAWIVHEFESPGVGLAVPISYLQPPEQTSRQP